jgi:hypothetical protein
LCANRHKPPTRDESRGCGGSSLAELLIAEHDSIDFCLIQERTEALTILAVGRGNAELGKDLRRQMKASWPACPGHPRGSAQRLTGSELHGRRVLFCKPLPPVVVMSASALRWRCVDAGTSPAMTADAQGHSHRAPDRQLTRQSLPANPVRPPLAPLRVSTQGRSLGANTIAFFTEIDAFRKHFALAGSSRRLCAAVYPANEKEQSRARYIPSDISIRHCYG